MPDKKDNDMTDWEMNDLLIYQLAKHIEESPHPYQVKDPQTDLFEYDEKISVETSKLGIDILQKINDNGK